MSEATEQWADTIDELANAAADFRANVPGGTHLGSEVIDAAGGSRVNYQKAQGKVRIGEMVLPERVPLYNLATRRMSMVPPTVAQARRMNGTKAFAPQMFALKKPDDWQEDEPIDETCPVCAARREAIGRPPRKFYDHAQLDAHFETVHPRAFRTAERRREEDNRRSDQALMRELIGTITTALAGKDVTAEEAESIAEQAVAEAKARPLSQMNLTQLNERARSIGLLGENDAYGEDVTRADILAAIREHEESK